VGRGRLGFIGGQIALHEGRYDQARCLLSGVLATPRHQEESLLTGYCFMNLGATAREQGDHDEATMLLSRALEIAVRFRDNGLLAHSFEGLSATASANGRHDRAMRLGGAAAALREATATPLNPAWQRMVSRWLALSRAALPAPVCSAAWQSGADNVCCTSRRVRPDLRTLSATRRGRGRRATDPASAWVRTALWIGG
jgi:tetratricopeptide (TPR) repeat protein